MKKVILYFILLMVAGNAYGQYGVYFDLDFDSGYVITTYGWERPGSYFNGSDWLSIDTVDYQRNQWQLGRPQKTVFNAAYSFPDAMVTDTLAPCLPNDTSAFTLKVPKNVWAGFGIFSFYYKLDIDTGDIALVEFSIDTGQHWINILADTTEYFYFQNSDTPNLSRSTNGWDSVALNGGDLSLLYALATDTLLFRFTLITDSSTVPREGWMIDNIVMAYYAEGVPIITENNIVSMYPNPSVTSLTIHAATNITNISINNCYGQIVYNSQCNNKLVQVNVADLPAGVYFVKINGADGYRGAVREFIKQ